MTLSEWANSHPMCTEMFRRHAQAVEGGDSRYVNVLICFDEPPEMVQEERKRHIEKQQESVVSYLKGTGCYYAPFTIINAISASLWKDRAVEFLEEIAELATVSFNNTGTLELHA